MTTAEIAKKLGLSKSTVSRAISGKGRIGTETRQQVLDYVERCSVTQHSADAPATHCLGVVIPADAYYTGIPFFQECLLGISEAAEPLEYHILIASGSAGDVAGVRTLVESNSVDGVILMRNIENDPALRYLTERKFPTGLVGQCADTGIIQVDSNNREAAESLVSLLVGRSYHRFALVVGDDRYQVNDDRTNGFWSAIDHHSLPREQQLYYSNIIDMDLLDSIISDVISKKTECILCGDDVICTRLMSRLQAKRYRIPRDVSIASLCNSANLDCFSPSVTAVNISARKVGNTLGKQMIYFLEGADYQPQTLMDYEILFRKSTGKVYGI